MLSTQHLSSLTQLSELARKWGYDYEMTGSATAGAKRPALEGTIKTLTLPYGVDLCLNELTAHEDDRRCGTLKQCLTILLTLDGDAPHYHLDDGQPLPAEIGVATVIVAQEPLHLWCHNPRGHRCRSLVIQATPARIKDPVLAQQVELLLHQAGITRFLVPHPTFEQANHLFLHCDNRAAARLQTHSLVLDLLAQGLQAAECTPALAPFALPTRDTARILQVRDKLLCQLDNNHCLCDLARDAGISVSALKSKFHALVGQSVFAFLREQRLIRARQGLESEGWTVKQAAYYVGYQHPSNFSTAYRRKFGCSPRDALNALTWLPP